MLLLLLFYGSPPHKCMSDKNRSTPIYMQPSQNKNARETLDDEFEPIRILFETSLLEPQTNDPRRCDSVSQEVDLSTGPYECESSDVLTSVKRTIIYSALDSLQTQLQSMLKIKRYQGAIEKQEWPEEVELPICNSSNPDCNSISGYDLIITVVAHPSAGLLVSESHLATVDSESHRPLHGYLQVNPSYIQSTESDFQYREVFMMTLMHEIIHLLGFHASLLQYYHPINDNTPFEQITCSIMRNNKNMTFLITPYAHTLAVKHFNLQTFEGDEGYSCPSGIELEDFENDYNHPKGRVFYSDISNYFIYSTSIKFTRLTDVTLALLLDTGNYQINYSYFQPLV